MSESHDIVAEALGPLFEEIKLLMEKKKDSCREDDLLLRDHLRRRLEGQVSRHTLLLYNCYYPLMYIHQ